MAKYLASRSLCLLLFSILSAASTLRSGGRVKVRRRRQKKNLPTCLKYTSMLLWFFLNICCVCIKVLAQLYYPLNNGRILLPLWSRIELLEEEEREWLSSSSVYAIQSCEDGEGEPAPHPPAPSPLHGLCGASVISRNQNKTPFSLLLLRESVVFALGPILARGHEFVACFRRCVVGWHMAM